MNTYTTVFQHNDFAVLRIEIDIFSRLTSAQVKSDATAIIELADDVLEGAELEFADWRLVEIKYLGTTIVTFAD